MKTFAVIGLGRWGRAIAEKLRELNNEVLAIDMNQELIDDYGPVMTSAICGDARDEKVLKASGIKNVDTAIVALGGDIATSTIITLTLKELGVKKVIAKASNEIEVKILEKVGADRVLIPEQIMGRKLAQTLSSERFLDFIELSGEYGIVELGTPACWVGKSLSELNIRTKYHVNVIGIRSKQAVNVSLTADTIFQAEDVVIVLGANNQLDKIRKL